MSERSRVMAELDGGSSAPQGGARRIAREAFLGLGVSLATVVLLFVVGEAVCRMFFPDTRLRYVSDRAALFHLAPNQVGTIDLANGIVAPPARINGLGLRGPDPDPARPTILVLGDSFTFGSGVRDEETFSARLDQWLGEVATVVNGGQPGYGIFQMAATLQRVGETLRPRLVIVVVWQGDLLRQPPDDIGRARFIKRQRISQFVKNSVLATHMYRRLERLLAGAGLRDLSFRVGEGDAHTGSTAQAVRESHLGGVRADWPRLLAMHREARRYGGGILLVLWPKADFAGFTEADESLARELTLELGQFAEQHGIPFISLQPAMRRAASKGRLMIPHDGHPTPLAHCLAAQVIAAELEDLGFRMRQEGHCDIAPSLSPSRTQPASTAWSSANRHGS